MAQQTQGQAQPKQTVSLYERVLYFLVALAIVCSGLSALENVGLFGLSDSVWRSSWLQNFSTEIFGAALTLVLIGRIIGEEDRRRELEENAKQLEAMREAVTKAVTDEMRRIQQANAVARLQAARDETKDKRQLILDEMRRADLLPGANLRGANLTGAGLWWVNLTGASLYRANLVDAKLQEANLRGTNLRGANLTGAGLGEADLTSADLGEANLTGANLRFASLAGASLQNANLDEKTILPDGSRYDPKQGLKQLERFTNPEHSDFWKPPAYQGDAEVYEEE